MGNILNKSAVLDRIKEHYSLKGNADLARFLGVAPNTITNWYGRSTFDIDVVYTKCEGVSFDWLFTGRSERIPKDQSSIPAPQPADESLLYTMYKEERIENKALTEEIGALKLTIRQQEETIAGLQQAGTPFQEDSTGSPRTRKRGVVESGSARFAGRE